MRTSAFVLSCMAVTGIAGTASAEFIGMILIDQANPNPDLGTFRVYALFSSPGDQLLAISGNPGYAELSFWTPSTLVNDGGAFAGFKQEDFAASPLSGQFDSWVTIGHSTFAGNDTDYSPGFLNNDGVTSVIKGSSWSSPDEGWFDSNPGTPATGTSILIAQFTTADPDGFFLLEGTVDWQPGPGDLRHDAFSVTSIGNPPAPTVLGLFVLAGARRRRRR